MDSLRQNLKTWVLIREGSRRCAVWLESVSGIKRACCIPEYLVEVHDTPEWCSFDGKKWSHLLPPSPPSYYVFCLYEIWYSYSSDWKEYCLLGCYTLCNVEEIYQPFKEELYCSAMKMAAIGCIKMIVNFHQTVQCHIPEPFFFTSV